MLATTYALTRPRRAHPVSRRPYPVPLPTPLPVGKLVSVSGEAVQPGDRITFAGETLMIDTISAPRYTKAYGRYRIVTALCGTRRALRDAERVHLIDRAG